MVEKNDEVMFSVELTTYNQEDYIAQTLQSIIDQKHNYKYEILVSDDCSTDGTQSVIEDFYKKYPEIIKPVYNEKNLGAMNNYYATIARAKGKYIMGCGGDDYWLPGKVEKQITFMEENPGFGLCYSRAKNYFEESNSFEGFIGNTYDDMNDIIFKGNCVSALTSCIRRSFLQKYLSEIKPQEKNWLMEDYPFNIFAFYETLVYFMSEPLAVYRVIKGSVCHQVNPKKQFYFEKSIYNVKKFFAEKYNLIIKEYNDKDLYDIVKESYSTNKIELDLLREELSLPKEHKSLIVIIKKIVKSILPYGIVINCNKIKSRKKD